MLYRSGCASVRVRLNGAAPNWSACVRDISASLSGHGDAYREYVKSFEAFERSLTAETAGAEKKRRASLPIVKSTLAKMRHDASPLLERELADRYVAHRHDITISDQSEASSSIHASYPQALLTMFEFPLVRVRPAGAPSDRPQKGKSDCGLEALEKYTGTTRGNATCWAEKNALNMQLLIHRQLSIRASSKFNGV